MARHAHRRSVAGSLLGHDQELTGERAKLAGEKVERVHARLQVKLLCILVCILVFAKTKGLAYRPLAARAQLDGVRGARRCDFLLRAERGAARIELEGTRPSFDAHHVHAR